MVIWYVRNTVILLPESIRNISKFKEDDSNWRKYVLQETNYSISSGYVYR